jgi:hypothetical protein
VDRLEATRSTSVDYQSLSNSLNNYHVLMRPITCLWPVFSIFTISSSIGWKNWRSRSIPNSESRNVSYQNGWRRRREGRMVREKLRPRALRASIGSRSSWRLSAHSVRKATVVKMLCSSAFQSQSAFERPLSSFNSQKTL